MRRVARRIGGGSQCVHAVMLTQPGNSHVPYLWFGRGGGVCLETTRPSGQKRFTPVGIIGNGYCFGPCSFSLGFSLFVYGLTRWKFPGHGSIQSGIGVISGWKCRANGRITVRFDGGRSIPLVYGSERTDTRGVCGDANNGFVAIWNWGALDDGTYTVVAYDNGREFDRATFTVVTTGVEFLRDVTGSGTATLSNGQQATLEWSQATQSFVATDFTDPRGTPVTPEPVETPEARQLRGLIGTWAFTLTVLDPPNQSPLRRSYTVSRVEQTDAGAGAIGRDPSGSIYLPRYCLGPRPRS